MRQIKTALITLSLLAPLAVPISAAASSPSLQGSYGDWRVYSRYDGAQRLCYVVSDAKTKAPSSVRHGDIHFLVANWKSGAATEQPSFMADFSLKSDRAPTVKIGSANYPMYVSRNEAFIADNSSETNLVDKMRTGSTMKINAMSQRGTNVSYTFSLKGITAALDKAKKACV